MNNYCSYNTRIGEEFSVFFFSKFRLYGVDLHRYLFEYTKGSFLIKVCLDCFPSFCVLLRAPVFLLRSGLCGWQRIVDNFNQTLILQTFGVIQIRIDWISVEISNVNLADLLRCSFRSLVLDECKRKICLHEYILISSFILELHDGFPPESRNCSFLWRLNDF